MFFTYNFPYFISPSLSCVHTKLQNLLAPTLFVKCSYYNNRNSIIRRNFVIKHRNYSTLQQNQENFLLTNTLKKSKFTDIYLSPTDFFNRDIFISKLSILDQSYRYSILFRVCFGSHPSYKMLGNQIGLNYQDCDNIYYLHTNLHDNLLLRLEFSMTNYNFKSDNIITIQLLAYKVEYTNTVQKKAKLDLTLNNLGENKDLVDGSKTIVDSAFNKILPVSMDLAKYGNPLKTNVSDG